jgi:hypothetical protein
MLLKDYIEEKKFDVRVVDRNISKGVVTWDEYQAHLKSISDDGDQLQHLEAEALEDEEQNQDQ